MGSAAVPPDLMDKVQRAFPGAAVKESYGLTEGGGPLRAPLDGRPVPRGSCGVPAPETEVKLVEGELWVRSPYVLKGYHNLPELTRERIVEGWLRTGDLFEVDAAGHHRERRTHRLGDGALTRAGLNDQAVQHQPLGEAADDPAVVYHGDLGDAVPHHGRHGVAQGRRRRDGDDRLARPARR